MYRIRLATGQEQVYRSIQELTAGVQRGEVTGEAEIYHQRTERWLSVESHPHYRMALEGGTATRTSRLKFTRPSTPAATSGVRPTPAAQRPEQSDLEELNRLLVLLDPLPSPTQRAEATPPQAPSPPDLKLVRPSPELSEKPEPDFGTMLRLEDLEPIPSAPPASLQVIRDERVIEDEQPVQAGDAEQPAPEAAAPANELGSDLGLPVEIRLDEIPVPEAAPVVASSPWPEPEPLTVFVEPLAEPAPVMAAAPVLPPPVVVDASPALAPERAEDAVSLEPRPNAVATRRRARPMLFVAGAAFIALAVFALTGGAGNADQGMVTPASATPPSDAAAPSNDPDSAVVPAGQSVGFPLPAPGTKPAAGAVESTDAASDSAPPAAVLPSAPTIDLSTSGTELVDAGASAPRSGARNGAMLARGYAQAYASLGTDFSAQMDRSGLVRLFSQTQITTSDGLSGARRALDAAATAVRQYHAREAVIERAYQDSARTLERSGATGADLRDWVTHPVLKESQEAAGEGVRLIGQIDAVFALLQSQAGHYRVDANGIRFENSDAAARYADLQGWITRRLEHWSGQPASSIPVTVQPLLEGVGLTRLPVSR